MDTRAPRLLDGERMKTPPVLSAAVAAAWLAIALAPGCGKQAEGDRCDRDRNGNDDCESEFVCTAAAELLDDSIDRCCPPGGGTGKCALKVGGTGGTSGDGGGGASGASGSSGASGASGASGSSGASGASGASGSSGASGGTGGATTDAALCRYTSECPGDLVCGPGGICQPECATSEDCAPPLVCSATGSCVAPIEGGTG